MKRFDSYLFRNILISTVFITFVLTAVVFLTQSLRFLELVMESGASSLTFWWLTSMALPKSFEIIIPLAMMASVIFVYNRMNVDSELVAIRAGGLSPYQIGRPALFLALIFTVFLYAITMFVAPMAQSNMHKMRQAIQAQFSNILFREGVFNQVGSGLTLYIRDKNSKGEMAGLIIHDNRNEDAPSTVIAKSGVIVNTDDAFQVVVYEGTRHQFDSEKRILQKLNFERYIIDLPESDPIRMRWQEPDERTIIELFNPDGQNERDIEALREFQTEINKRLSAPLLTIAFTLMALATLLLGPQDRRGQGKRIIIAIGLMVLVQGLYMAATNIAADYNAGLVFMYVLIILPIAISGFLLSGAGDNLRRKLFYKPDMAHSGESES